jgi:PhnB protein
MRPGFHSVTPYLITRGAAEAIEFYKKAFGATELMRVPASDGRLMHSELQIGDSQIMMADEHPEMGYVSPLTLGKSPVGFMLYVEDADAVYARAIAAGAKSIGSMADKEYGRSGIVEDPFGYQWYVTAHKG